MRKPVRSTLTFRCSFGTVRLHGHVSVEVVQGAVCLLAAVPSALVHAINLLVPSSGALVLLCARDGDEGVDL